MDKDIMQDLGKIFKYFHIPFSLQQVMGNNAQFYKLYLQILTEILKKGVSLEATHSLFLGKDNSVYDMRRTIFDAILELNQTDFSLIYSDSIAILVPTVDEVFMKRKISLTSILKGDNIKVISLYGITDALLGKKIIWSNIIWEAKDGEVKPLTPFEEGVAIGEILFDLVSLMRNTDKSVWGNF